MLTLKGALTLHPDGKW